MGKAMQEQMDTKTQNSQIYIGTPNGIVLCADEGSGHSLRGRFYHAYSRDAIYFENANQLVSEMEKFFDSIQSFNPILDFLRLDIVLPDEQCIPYEEAKQKSIDVIEAMDGWKPEMTEHIDVMVELIYIPDGMDHPVWQFIYALASDVFYSKAVLSEEEYTNEMSAKNKQMMEEEKAVFGGSQNLPIHISIRIDAYTGEQVGETFLETPPVCGIGYTGIVLWK